MMSEEGESSVRYKDGEIVWVKLGSAWWPGEVTENVPEECNSSFKKPPLCAVKFFNESTFEFVKSYNNIYFYNCERKNEFIKKGMDSYRANNVHMEKFPIDVSLAEVKTDGNPNILSDPLFGPQKKKSIVAEVFGTPTTTKKIKDGLQSTRGRPSKGSLKKNKSKGHITHRRFLGFDDFESHIRVQFPGKDKREQVDEGEEVLTFEDESNKSFPCSQCPFKTDRIEVMIYHVQTHMNGGSTPSSSKKKTKRQRKPKVVRKPRGDEDGGRLSSTESEGEVPKPKQKRKRRSQGPSKKSKQKKTAKESQVDIRSNLLAEWSDSGSEDDDGTDVSKANMSAEDKSPTKKGVDGKDVDKSCFDFNDDDEEEEEDSGVHTAVGRKIPRVIPPTDRRKSSDPNTEDASLPLAEDDENRMEILKVNDNLDSNEGGSAKDDEDDGSNKDLVAFKDLMDSTALPELPELPDAVTKCAQNFPTGQTIKFPDKEVATKLTNPKKRFVKSFEDFELLQYEQRKAQQEEKDKNDDKPKEEDDEPKEEKDEPKEGEEIPKEETKAVVEENKDKTLDEPKPTNEEKSSDSDTTIGKFDNSVQISKLRGQVMSKLEEETDSPKTTRGSRSSPRTPRSKILESYNEEKKRRRSGEVKKSEEKDKPREGKVKKVPTKKLKYLKNRREDSDDDMMEETVESEEPPAKVDEPETSADAEEEKPQEEDEETAKIDDGLMTNSEQPKSPPKPEEANPDGTSNEVHIKCSADDGDNSSANLDFSIKTNLTNFSKSEDEMSALTTLAAVSEMKTNIDSGLMLEDDFLKVPPIPSEDLIAIDGNLTVVSEKDLADGQVEIAADTSLNNSKPVTLTTFSMDFSDVNSNESSSRQIELSPNKEVEVSIGKKDQVTVAKVEEKVAVTIHETTAKKVPQSSSKLLERLTTNEVKVKENSTSKFKVQSIYGLDNKNASVSGMKESPKVFASNKNTKFVVKPIMTTAKTNKPIILSEKIIKPEKAPESVAGNVLVQKITSKKFMQDADEIDTFIIQKGAKHVATTDDEASSSSADATENSILHKTKKHQTVEAKKQVVNPVRKPRGKAKILQQTIISASGEIIQPAIVSQSVAVADDNVFDINSMPIVMGDQILTPESIENMPIYLSDALQSTGEPVVVKKMPAQPQMRLLNKSMASSSALVDSKSPKLVKTTKVLPGVGQKIIKHNSYGPGNAVKQGGKYVIMSQASSTTTTTTPQTSKYTVGKRQAVVKRPEMSGTLSKVQNLTPEPSGNKIMILTNQQGVQQRVLLTPAQQKLIGYQTPGSKTTKTLVKGNIIQKGRDGHLSAVAGSSGLVQKVVSPASRVGGHQTMTSSGHVLTPLQHGKVVGVQKTIAGRKIQVQPPQKVLNRLPQQKTILIKNQHGQTVRRIQGTDDALLDQQVAEQIEAIKASGGLQNQIPLPPHKPDILNYKTPPRNFRKSYVKRPSESPKVVAKTHPVGASTSAVVVSKEAAVLPPLAPISPIKKATVVESQIDKSAETKKDRPLNQLVIQDAMGNQTTITEGQILALPSETLDGQPQSYMLVTLDESGNLTPLNNEALMSLDPNLGLGGDLSNTVLQIDENALKDDAVDTTAQSDTSEREPQPVEVPATVSAPLPQLAVAEEVVTDEPIPEAVPEGSSQPSNDSGQQLIVTGDPIAAQKFLESLTEGNSDLANILANAEGSILIHADGQQILINTDSDNQMLLSVNADNLNMTESTEGGGNPIFATQPLKNQDILAAALADTDVFQQEAGTSQSKSQLSPGSALYPMNVGNVLETSLTLNSPIMTPLEVPSTNCKKISDEQDILGHVTKNVDLPITITDPNITQTVSQQQVANLIANSNDLQDNLQLSLQDSAISAPSTEMNSPSFAYSLPNLDETVDMEQKPFNSSMPLLTEDADESLNDEAKLKTDDKVDEVGEPVGSEMKSNDVVAPADFLEETEGLCTLGGEMCSSLSEPPPDMFDLSAVLAAQIKPKVAKVEERPSTDLSNESANPDTIITSSPTSANEDSSEIEIPVQPEIVTSLNELGGGTKRGMDDDKQGDDNSKKCKLD